MLNVCEILPEISDFYVQFQHFWSDFSCYCPVVQIKIASGTSLAYIILASGPPQPNWSGAWCVVLLGVRSTPNLASFGNSSGFGN
jgi:hypothetical protein